jgi:hypothetical protein
VNPGKKEGFLLTGGVITETTGKRKYRYLFEFPIAYLVLFC